MKLKLVLFFLFVFLKSQAQTIEIGDAHLTRITKKGTKFALENYEGITVVSNLDSIYLDTKTEVYLVKKKNKYGLYSSYGVALIPLKYSKIERLYNQFWMVEASSKKGVYNINNNTFLPPRFDDIEFSYKVGAELLVKKDNKFGIYNDRFEEVAAVMYDAIENRSIIALEAAGKKEYVLQGKRIDKQLLMDKTFQAYGTYLSDTKNYYIFEKHHQLGVIDEENTLLIPASYTDIIPKRVIQDTHSETVLLAKKNNKWGMIDLNNAMLVPFEFESIDFATPNYLIVGIDNSKQFYNLEQKRLVPAIHFDRFYHLDKYARLEKEGLETLIDMNTLELIFPFKYESVMYLKESNTFSVKLHGKYGIIDATEKQIIPIHYEELTIFSCGNKAVVKKDGQYGIIDNNNTVLVPFTNRYIIAYSDSFERRKEKSFDMEVFDCDLNIME